LESNNDFFEQSVKLSGKYKGLRHKAQETGIKAQETGIKAQGTSIKVLEAKIMIQDIHNKLKTQNGEPGSHEKTGA
jgi:hypothetical protein